MSQNHENIQTCTQMSTVKTARLLWLSFLINWWYVSLRETNSAQYCLDCRRKPLKINNKIHGTVPPDPLTVKNWFVVFHPPPLNEKLEPPLKNTKLSMTSIVQQNGEICVHFIIPAWNFAQRCIWIMLFHTWARGKLNYFNMAVKFTMAAIGRFYSVYALVMRSCIKPWSLNDAYYTEEITIIDEYNFSNIIKPFVWPPKFSLTYVLHKCFTVQVILKANDAWLYWIICVA